MAKIKLVYLILIPILFISACSITINEDINSLAIEYMEDKYGEQFTYVEAYGDSMDGTRSFFVVSESFPDEKILVEIEDYNSEDRRFFDNYTTIIYQEETIELIEACANEVWNESNIYYEVNYLTQSSELNCESTFNDFLQMNVNYLRFDIEIKESMFDNENKVNNFINSLLEYTDLFKFRVLIVSDDTYGGVDRDSMDDKITQNEYIKLAIAEVNGELDAIEWNE